MNKWPQKTLNGVTMCADPAREPCFKVAQFDAEMQDDSTLDPEAARRERLHRHMNNEIGSMEIAAQTLVDFPEADWELRMQLARQTYDESRHVEGLYRRFRAKGGIKGEFPISNFEWCVTILQDSMAARLALSNRTFEAGQMDLLGTLRQLWRAAGDEETAEMLEIILADEVNHVRFANRWMKRLVKEDARVLLKVAMAVRFLPIANQASSNATGLHEASFQQHVRMGVNVDDRRHAEFSDNEINEILRQHGMPSLADAVSPKDGVSAS